MKIIYIHQYFNTPSMPGVTRSYEMAKRLVAKGHEVHMITTYREQDAETKSWFQTIEDGIIVHWLPVLYSNHMSYLMRLKSFFHFAVGAVSKASSLQADIVFATSTPLSVAIPGVITARRKKVPFVFEVRDLWPELPIVMGALKNPILRFMARQLEKWAYNNATSVVALSPGMRDGVIKTGFPKDRVAIIPNSCDNKLFNYCDEGENSFLSTRPHLMGKPFIVYAGALGRLNGVDYLSRIAKEMLTINEDIRFLVIGDGSEKDKIQHVASANGTLNKNFFMEPPLPKNDMPALFAAATMTSSMFIDIPEMRVNSSNKFFDGLASGTPVLINYGGWHADLLSQNNAGLVTWNMDIKTAAEQIASHITNEQWIETAAQAAKELAINFFDRDLLAGRLEKVLVISRNLDDSNVHSITEGNFDDRDSLTLKQA